MKFKAFENTAVIVFIFFILISGMFGVSYFNSKGIFDAEVIYVNNLKSPYSVLLSFDNEVNEELEFNVEVIYKRGNLVASRDKIQCLGICEAKLVIDKIFFDEYEVVIWTEYRGRLYEKKLDFIFEKPPAQFSVSVGKNYIWKYGNDVSVNGNINTNIDSKVDYIFDVFPTKTPGLRTTFKKTCDGSCPFNFSLKSNILFGEYTINVYSQYDIVKTTFNVVTGKDQIIEESNSSQIEIPKRYIRPKLEKIPLKQDLQNQFFLTSNSKWEGDWNNVDSKLDKLDSVFKKNRIGEVEKILEKGNDKFDLDIDLGGSGLKFSNVKIDDIKNFSVYYDETLPTDVVYVDTPSSSFDSSLVILRKDGGFLENINVCDNYTDIETYNSMLNLSEEDPLTEDTPGYANQLCLSGWRDSKYDFEQNETHVWFNTTHFSAYSGSLFIFNPQSYPVVGGLWRVEFNTTGSADLWLSASNGTTWSRDGDSTDLQFMNLMCGSNVVDYEWINGSVFVSNYSCSENTYETSRVITGGVHTKQFVYGVDVGYAKNFATDRGSGFLAYIEDTVTTPRYRVYDPDTNSWSAELSANSVGQSIEEVQVACSVARFECALLTVDSGDDVEIQFYNGSCWHDGTTCGNTYTLETTTDSEIGQRASMMYEGDSGDLLVVWGTTTADDIEYRIWDGSSWSSEGQVQTDLGGSLNTAGNIEWIELAQEPETDNIGMIYRTSSNEGGVVVYDGDSEDFSCELGTPFTGLTAALRPNVDIEYEQVSGDLFAVGGISSTTEFNYVTKSSGSCSYSAVTDSSSVNYNEQSDQIRISPVWDDDTILVGIKADSGNDMDIGAWSGSALLADGGGDTATEAEANGNRQIDVACPKDGTDRCIGVFADSNDLSVSYYTYTPSTNTWSVGSDYDGATAMANQGQDVIECSPYPFDTDSEIMCIFSDDADDLFAKSYDASTDTWSDTEGGSALETNNLPAEYKGFSFNWVIFDAPYKPIAVDPLDGSLGNQLSLDLTAYVEDPNSDLMLVSFYWGNGTEISTAVIPSDWADVDSPFRQPINVTGATSSILNYTYEISLNSGNVGLGFDFSIHRDTLRFYYYNVSSGTSTLIPHYANTWDSGGSTADILVKVPYLNSGVNAPIYMYYGDIGKSNGEDFCSVYLYCDQFDDASISAELTTSDETAPYNNAAFSEGSGVLSITAGGDDTWTGDDEYGSVYYDNLEGDFEAIVTISSFTNPDAWAKAGIMFRNDMTASGSSTGYGFNTLTPGNGYSFQYDGNDNGFLDTNLQACNPSVAGSYLRLIKSGTSFTGYCSKVDRSTWSLIGSGTIGSANTIQDVGLSYTSHAGATTGTVTYDDFTIQRYTSDSISSNIGSQESTTVVSLSGTNATASVSGLSVLTNYTWYVVASDGLYTSTSDVFSFTTKSLTPPIGNLISPPTMSAYSEPNVTFSANATDIEDGLDYATLYVWDDDGDLFFQKNESLNNSFSSIFYISDNFPAGNYTWNIEAMDLGSNGAFLGSSNRTFSISVPSVVTQYLNMFDPFFIRQNTTRYLDVNISCLGGNCQDINTTFYYMQPQLPVSDSEDFEASSFGNWVPESADACTWSLDQGGTPSGSTGPSVDHTDGDATGWYIYVETSGSGTTPPYFCDGTDSEAIMNSTPFMAGSVATNISFWYHMYGATIGTLHLDVFDGSWNNDVWSLTGQQQGSNGAAYINQVVDLSAYSGIITIRFRYDWGGSFTGDIALDDIVITTQSDAYAPIDTFSTSPLWTNSSNPETFSLNEGEYQVVRYYINASGAIGGVYDSFVGSIMNSVVGYNSNESSFDISIVGEVPPVGYKVAPLNDTSTDNTSVIFQGNATSVFGLSEAELHVWNEVGSLVTSPSIFYSGEFIENASWNFTFPYDGEFTWNILFTDIYGDSSWADNETNFTITKTSRSADLNVTITNPSTLTPYPVQTNNTFTLTTLLTCETVIETNCGNVTAYLQYNNSISSFSNVVTTSNMPFWTTDSQPQSCYLSNSQNCTLTWEINASGLPETEHLIRVITTSNSSYVSNKTSDNLTVQILDGDTVLFSTSSLDLGSIIQNRGDATRDTPVRAFIGNHTGITISCISGNCSLITDDWSDGSALNEGNSLDVIFTCSDTTQGSLQAIFELDSNEDNSPTTISVLCSVTPEPGSMNVTISSPNYSEVFNVSHDKTFTLNATVNCVDNCGDVKGYVIYPMDDPFWNINWEYRRNLAIDVTTAVSTGYQILLHLNNSVLGGNFNWANNCNDIRFINGSNILDYWVETCNTSSQEIYVWIETDSALGSSSTYEIDLYYGNNDAVSRSNASNIFRENEIFLVTGACSGGGTCDMDNHVEADTLRANIGNGAQTIQGTGYVNDLDDPDNPYGANDNYYTRYRLLWIPSSNASYSFGSYNDDDMEIAIFPYDSYGGGITGYNDFGANDPVTTQYGNWHNNGACGSNVAIEGTRSLIEGEGYWLDYISIEGGGGEDQRMCIDSGSGYNTFNIANFGGEFFARSYVEGTEPQLVSVGSEEILDSVSTFNGADPFWIELNQPQSCTLLFTGTCVLSWEVNASDLIWNIYNLSVIISSDIDDVLTNESENLTVRIVNLDPSVELIFPYGKVISNGTVEFSYNVSDYDDSIFDCRLFIDSNLVSTETCYYGENKINLSLPSFGDHNWSVNATDYYFGSNISEVFNFTLIKDQNLKITKSVQSVGANLYSGNYTIENQIVSNQNVTILTFLDDDYSVNSFSPSSSFNYPTYLFPYLGDVYGSNISLPTLTFIEKVNFSANGISDFELSKFFIFGLE